MKKRIISILALALVFTGCSFNNSDSDSDAAEALASIFSDEKDIDAGADKDTASANNVADDSSSKAATNERNGAPGSDNTVGDKPSGIYSREYTEEIEGEETKSTFSVTFKEDGTGSMTFQDTIKMTWADGVITTESGDTYEYEYKADGDTVKIKDEFGWQEYCKK